MTLKPQPLSTLGLLPLLLALTAYTRILPAQDAGKIQQGEMAGYLLVPNSKVPDSYDAGFSLYVAAWPLLDQYPGQRFQTGLFGTWMFARNEGPPPLKLYSDIEGGLGWWRDTEFATETPKFIMGGVAPNFSEWANGPGAGKGRDWDQPKGKYGVAQLSPWLLWPPDGLNLKQGTCGELFGYGYLPLPLTSAKATTAGTEVPTGDQSWTLFLNTRNFKGPVAFFTPYFWSRSAVAEPRFRGLLLDSRPSNPNRALQMETQHVPSVQSVDAQGETYARVAPTFFPCASNVESWVVHRITSYNRKALWDPVKSWFDGGAEVSGAIHPDGAMLHEFSGKGGATWRIYADGVPKEERVPLAWDSFATPMAPDPNTFGYRWDSNVVKRADSTNGPLVQLPEYFHLVKTGGKPQWVPVREEAVPAETGLVKARFDRPERRPKAYVTPEDPASCWKRPGPKAGPFRVKLGDGSVVTYCWYRFADQPALLNADMTEQEREGIQTRVEKLHRIWKKDREYLAPPAFGKLAELDPALIVTPPPGLEAGHVPIVTRQEAED
ncbi:MAG: hypothetical protein MUC91_14435 [Verrucomicrobia bacterium]|nr:hypothetical protein [Verrucomicrobiota bacterium]